MTAIVGERKCDEGSYEEGFLQLELINKASMPASLQNGGFSFLIGPTSRVYLAKLGISNTCLRSAPLPGNGYPNLSRMKRNTDYGSALLAALLDVIKAHARIFLETESPCLLAQPTKGCNAQRSAYLNSAPIGCFLNTLNFFRGASGALIGRPCCNN
jgi:hypothetical protein